MANIDIMILLLRKKGYWYTKCSSNNFFNLSWGSF